MDRAHPRIIPGRGIFNYLQRTLHPLSLCGSLFICPSFSPPTHIYWNIVDLLYLPFKLNISKAVCNKKK